MSEESPDILENGHVDIAHPLVKKFASYRISGEEWQVLWVIMMKTWAWHKSWDKIALKTFYKETSIKKPHIIRLLHKLIDKNIVTKKGNKNPYKWHINSHIKDWKSLPKKVTVKGHVTKKGNGVANKGNGVANKGKIKSPEHKLRKAQRIPKETTSKETTSKEIKHNHVELSKNTTRLFSFWKEHLNHPKAILTKDRRSKIRARLMEGYTVEQGEKAIVGCKSSSYHMGDNPQGRVYDSIELIFRNGDKIEQFISIYEEAQKYGKGKRSSQTGSRQGWQESDKYRKLYSRPRKGGGEATGQDKEEHH